MDKRIVFLGTAGGRIVVFKQIRASGGIWVTLNNINLHIDPGPGALIRALKSKANLDPEKLDAIILSHEHLDHSADVNVMIEAMTQGGFKPRGTLFATKTALEDDPVVLRYVRNYLNDIKIIEEGATFEFKGIKISTPVRNIHGQETYGIIIEADNLKIAYTSDTRFFEKMLDFYRGDILILNTLRLTKKHELDHLDVEDARIIISQTKPKLAILTHFGMTMVRAHPWEVAKKLQDELGTKVIAANDGMILNLDTELLNIDEKPKFNKF